MSWLDLVIIGIFLVFDLDQPGARFCQRVDFVV